MQWIDEVVLYLVKVAFTFRPFCVFALGHSQSKKILTGIIFFLQRKLLTTYPKDGHLQQNTTGKLHSSLTCVLILTVGSDFGQSVTFEGCCTGRGNP